jgi:hypothetical protein
VAHRQPGRARGILVDGLGVETASAVAPAEFDDDAADARLLEASELLDREGKPAVLIPRNVEGQRA